MIHDHGFNFNNFTLLLIGGCMAKKRGKSVSFDAMVKFFMNTYDIPTKRDLVMLINRLDRIERLVLNSTTAKGKQKSSAKADKKSGELSASEIVLEIIQRYGDGVGLAEIQLQSGFGEKNCAIFYSDFTKWVKSRE